MERGIGRSADKLRKALLVASVTAVRPWYLVDAGRLAGRELFRKYYEDRACVPEENFSRLVPEPMEVKLADFECRDGNVSPYELLVIAGLVRYLAPRVLLEIGTFDGNTTLQMALNAPPDALVYTLDLPPDCSKTTYSVENNDLRYIRDPGRDRPRFARRPEVTNVVRLFGDSATFNFQEALHGRTVDFAFIDGSHSYAYVKNDTQKVFQVLGPGGGWFSGMTGPLPGPGYGNTSTN